MTLRPAAALLAALLALAGLVRIAESEIIGNAETRASDALPLYLSGAAVAAGLDPTRERSLSKVYDERGLSVGAATFSTLYPATAGVVMRMPAALSWPAFSTLWRWILLGAVTTFGFAAAGAVAGDRWTRLLWGSVVTAVLAWHPVTGECVRLGQVNMVLGALCAVAMAGVSGISTGGVSPGRRGWAIDLVVGAALGLGGALKLVPAALLLPLVATRRWRPTVGAAAIGLLALALVLPITPLPRVIEAIRETLRFQATIDPDWLVGRDPAPDWMRLLGFIRHTPLQWITLAAVAIVPAARPSARTALAGMALLCAWLGADAAGFHVLYAPLAYPVFLLLVGRPVAFVGLAATFYVLSAAPASLGAEPRMVLFGLVAWVAAATALLRDAAAVPAGALEADGEARQAALAMAGVATGFMLAGAVPGEGPVAAPLPEGQTTPEGAGFIRPSDRVPGEVRALGGGLDRPASTLARPGTVRALQLYLRGASVAWGQLAERYPARAALCAARAGAAPAGDLRDHSGRVIAAWLVEERATVTRLQAEGLDLGDLPTALTAALASGLADPDLDTRIPNGN
ncbi:MAG: glycosyltransferase 87 family protein [Pseudomonadota bacterium]|nr:glycosyltransferase 87 family protein [Pseudomonadota bacterium]